MKFVYLIKIVGSLWVFPLETLVSSINKTNLLNIAEILLTETLNTHNQFYWWRKPEYPENPPPCRKSLTNFITYCCIEYTSPWTGFERTTLVVIDIYIGSCKSNTNAISNKYCNNIMNCIMCLGFFWVDFWCFNHGEQL